MTEQRNGRKGRNERNRGSMLVDFKPHVGCEAAESKANLNDLNSTLDGLFLK